MTDITLALRLTQVIYHSQLNSDRLNCKKNIYFCQNFYSTAGIPSFQSNILYILC